MLGVLLVLGCVLFVIHTFIVVAVKRVSVRRVFVLFVSSFIVNLISATTSLVIVSAPPFTTNKTQSGNVLLGTNKQWIFASHIIHTHSTLPQLFIKVLISTDRFIVVSGKKLPDTALYVFLLSSIVLCVALSNYMACWDFDCHAAFMTKHGSQTLTTYYKQYEINMLLLICSLAHVVIIWLLNIRLLTRKTSDEQIPLNVEGGAPLLECRSAQERKSLKIRFLLPSECVLVFLSLLITCSKTIPHIWPRFPDVMVLIECTALLSFALLSAWIIWKKKQVFEKLKRKEIEEIPFEWDSITPWKPDGPNIEMAVHEKKDEEPEDNDETVEEVDFEYDDIIPWH